MSTLSQFVGGGGGIKPTGLINGASTFNIKSLAGLYQISSGFMQVVSSPALTANTLATVLSLSGKGALSMLMCQASNTTSRTHRIKLTLDGVVVFDATQTAGAQKYQFAVGTCAIVVDAGTIYDISFLETPLLFDTSCLVEFSSSVTETGNSLIGYRYYPL